MFHLHPKLKKVFPFLHKRAITEADLHAYCDDRNVKVIFDPDISSGVWVVAQGKQHIWLNNKLRGWRRLYVFTHEVAHSIFHAASHVNTGVEFFDLHTKNKNHFEAEVTCALLLLPIPDLKKALIDGLDENNPEIAKLMELRFDLHKKYKV